MTQTALELAKKWIKDSDALLITASNGFAISEGLNLFTDNPNMRKALKGTFDRYHFQNLLSAFAYPYDSPLERWSVLAPVIDYFSYGYQDSAVMKQLKALIADKDYYIWTSNTDHHFVQAGLKNVFEIEGNWLEGICSNGHSQDLSIKIHELAKKTRAGSLQDRDLPVCQVCGESLELNLPGDHFQINQKKLTEIQDFISNYQGKSLLVIELGIGASNQLIKAPSMELVASHPNHRYITINKGEVYISPSVTDQAIGIDGLLTTALEELLTGKEAGSQFRAPKIDKKQQTQETQLFKQVYPSMTQTQGSRYGGVPRYVTLDAEHVSHFHSVQYGQSLLYAIGDTATVHCISPGGEYKRIRIGLDKSKNDVHGAYIEAGSLMAIEHDPDGLAGFSQISINSPFASKGIIQIPNKSDLIIAFPEYQELIDRLALDGNWS